MSTHSVRGSRLLWSFGILAVLAALVWSVSSFAGTASAQVGDVPSASAGAASSWYMKIGDIEGESNAEGYEGWSELTSVSQAITGPTAASPGVGRRRAAATFEDIVVEKIFDAASPKLMEAIATGRAFPQATIHAVRSGETGRQVYLAFELEHVQVTNYQLYGSEGNATADQISLNYEEIKVTYTKTANDGSPGGKVEFTWDIAANTR